MPEQTIDKLTSPRRWPKLILKPREDPHHALGDTAVVPHEPLNSKQPVARDNPAFASNPRLLFTRELIASSACREMQIDSHPEQK